MLVAKGDYAEAELLFWRAVLINAKALGPDHRYVAATFNNLGALHRAKGDYAGADCSIGVRCRSTKKPSEPITRM